GFGAPRDRDFSLHDALPISGGLHGVGVTVVNALSEWLKVEVHRDGGYYTQSYTRGTPDAPLKRVRDSDLHGTKVTFKPDAEIFRSEEHTSELQSRENLVCRL